MEPTHIVGVDPGLVHTGVVSLLFLPDTRAIVLRSYVIDGPDTLAVATAVGSTTSGPKPHVFIEKYQPRSNLNSDTKMVSAVSEMHKALPGSKVLLNTGVKQVVRKPLMDLLDTWSFTTKTHHQDLRSAARIAIYGMLKNESLNSLLTRVVVDHTEGRSWHVASN